MISAFRTVGITMNLDKSAFQCFNEEEFFQLQRYFEINITPILVMEILGDLTKKNDEALNSVRVIDFSKKLSGLSSSVNSHYSALMVEELTGNVKIPFYNSVVDTGELLIGENGQKIVKIHPSAEREALDRWQEGNFTETEKIVSKYWRENTTEADILTKLQQYFKAETPLFKILKTPGDILNLISGTFQNKELHLSTIDLLIKQFHIPVDEAAKIFYRWECMEEKNLERFAPYSFFCLRIKLLFNICLQNEIISTRPTNLLDLEYLYYLPFCKVFVSDDKIHKTLVPWLLTSKQRFVTGKELKEDLQKIKGIKEGPSQEDQARAEKEPPRVKDLLIYNIWQQMVYGWPPEKDWEPSEAELEMMHEAIRNFRNAKPAN